MWLLSSCMLPAASKSVAPKKGLDGGLTRQVPKCGCTQGDGRVYLPVLTSGGSFQDCPTSSASTCLESASWQCRMPFLRDLVWCRHFGASVLLS